MKKQLLLFTAMTASFISAKAATISETIDGFFKPIVENYLIPVIFWDPIKFFGFDVGADVPIVVVWLIFGAIFFTFKMKFINFRGFKHAIGLV
jgi:AGCS family alanine or glycine:cation symporter